MLGFSVFSFNLNSGLAKVYKKRKINIFAIERKIPLVENIFHRPFVSLTRDAEFAEDYSEKGLIPSSSVIAPRKLGVSCRVKVPAG